MENPSFRILIAEDSPAYRTVLARLLKRLGHIVYVACDGQEAVSIYKREKPDIVMLDAMMPVLDGKDAAKQIKALADDKFVPIMFITGISDQDELAVCLEAGGDDVLIKPFNEGLLQTKIMVFARMMKLYERVTIQRDELSYYKDMICTEQEIARKVYDNITQARAVDVPNMRYMLSPKSTFNGDLFLASVTKSGNLNILVGDFTGHGLSAAIGAMPISDIFYGMTSKGHGIEEIAAEINKKLKIILPPGLFCAACLIHVDCCEHMVRIWNGGLPEAFIFDNEHNLKSICPSSHLPLGIQSPEVFDSKFTVVDLDVNDRIFFYSDGVIEAKNPDGEEFGKQNLLKLLSGQSNWESVFDEVQDALRAFSEDEEQADDISLVEIRMLDKPINVCQVHKSRPGDVKSFDFDLQLELGADTLKQFNPVPYLLDILTQSPGFENHSSRVYRILKELYVNALEYGVLGLVDEKKSMELQDFCKVRGDALCNLESGFINFILKSETDELGTKLRIIVEDSGAGFDFESAMSALDKEKGDVHCGIPLVHYFSESVHYSNEGRAVEVVYRF